MRNIYLAIVLFAIIAVFACNNSMKPVAKHSAPPKDSSALLKTVKQQAAEGTLLDTAAFLDHINAFIPTITTLPRPYTCQTDTWDNRKSSYLGQLPETENNIVLVYTFDAGSYFKAIKVMESIYKDSMDTNKAFAHMTSSTNKKFSFCLTKTNDFVVKTGKKIIWLNGSCMLPFHNFMKIARYFESSLRNYTKLDSIKCKCGGMKVR
jgi:hypothetical protein